MLGRCVYECVKNIENAAAASLKISLVLPVRHGPNNTRLLRLRLPLCLFYHSTVTQLKGFVFSSVKSVFSAFIFFVSSFCIISYCIFRILTMPLSLQIFSLINCRY